MVREKQSEAFHSALSGYQIKELLAEPIGEEALQWIAMPAHLRRDYSDYFQENGIPIPEPSQRSWLVGLTKGEALAHPGSHLAGSFVYTRPRFHFTSAEQALLQRALMGETGEELAKSLCLSPWTVKKRWQAIYERVATVDSELLPPPVTNGAEVASVARSAGGTYSITCDSTRKSCVRSSR